MKIGKTFVIVCTIVASMISMSTVALAGIVIYPEGDPINVLAGEDAYNSAGLRVGFTNHIGHLYGISITDPSMNTNYLDTGNVINTDPETKEIHWTSSNIGVTYTIRAYAGADYEEKQINIVESLPPPIPEVSPFVFVAIGLIGLIGLIRLKNR